LYSQAYALRCDKLLKDLCDHIQKNLLTITNVVHFLQESIEFEIPSLNESTLGLIVCNFKEICNRTPDFLFGLPIRQFISIIKSDDLHIDNEFELVEIVKKCLAFHKEHGENLPIDPQIEAGPDIWSRLTEKE
jgi:BTB And C-terminal Kelch